MSIELKFEILSFVNYFILSHLWRFFGKPLPSNGSGGSAWCTGEGPHPPFGPLAYSFFDIDITRSIKASIRAETTNAMWTMVSHIMRVWSTVSEVRNTCNR